MKPHIFKRWGYWVCEIRIPAIQRGAPTPVTIYSATGDTPAEAQEKCEQCKYDRTMGPVK